MSFITTLIVKLKGFLFRFVANKILVVVIANCAVLFIVELSEIIKNTLKQINTKIMTLLNSLENWLFSVVHDSYTALENALRVFRQKIENALNALMPDEINIILSLINFAVWLDLLVISTISSIKSSTQTIISTALNPILAITGTITNTITAIEQAVNQIQNSVNQNTKSLWDTANTQLTTQQNNYNTQIEGFINKIGDAFDWYNEGVNAIETAANIQKQIIDNHHIQADNVINQISSILQSYPISTNDLDTIGDLLAQIQPISTAASDIDYNQYKILVISDTPTFVLTWSMPDMSVDLTPIKSQLLNLQTNINIIDNELKQLPTQTQTQFINSFPSVLTTNITTQLKQLLILAVGQLIIRKRQAVIDALTDMKTSINNYQTTKRTEIMTKAVEVMQEINQEITELMQTIPNLLKPSLERYLDKIMEEVEKAQDEITDNVQITDFIADIETIQSIMMTIPTDKYKPKTTPLITKKRKRKNEPLLTIQDIHRILCDNFYRNERLALLFTLAPHDIRVETSDITQLLLELQP